MKKTMSLAGWQLTPWENKGYAGCGTLATILIKPDGSRRAVIVYDGDERVSWLDRDPTEEQFEWQMPRE